MTAEMAPSARLVVYAIRGDGEVVVDSLTLTVDGLFKNKVTHSPIEVQYNDLMYASSFQGDLGF